MKLSILLIGFILLAPLSSILAQRNEVYKLDREVELMLDSAAKHMIIFILSQNEMEYDRAIERINKADQINSTLLSKSEKLWGIRKRIQDYIAEDRAEEFKCYDKDNLRTVIINEKQTCRTIKVRFKGKTYRLSDDSKKMYDNFISFLPRN